MNYNDDLEFREERNEISTSISKQTVKKHIPLRLKSSNQTNVSLSLAPVQTQVSSTSITATSQANPKDQVNRSDFQTLKTNLNSQQQQFANVFPPESINSDNSEYLIKSNHPITNLNWNMNINSISQKTLNQAMDYCMICYLPILIYGRLIPCKHVMCIHCANNINLKVCLKECCLEMIERIERIERNNIFVCNYQDTNNKQTIESFRFQPDISQKKQCGKSYLSQRDLQAHVIHRHNLNEFQA